jgi:aminoglycoside/choline kinase family phosphotransferase
MSKRDALIRAFIDATDWAGATVAPLAGDASNRRYLRLTHPQGAATAVLMDAPSDRGEDVRPFVSIAAYLGSIGLSAPRILAQDPGAGLLLLEDLGDDLFANVIPADPSLENSLYSCATDLLADLHSHPVPSGLRPYDPPLMADLAALAFDWYLTAITGADTAARRRFHDAMLDALNRHASTADVLVQRDYHAQNLLWLPQRQGLARVGLLDFQDAMLGHRAYDLVSLLQDARRDVPRAIEDAMIHRYIAATGQDDTAFRTAYHVLGAQRNLRILGVFARLCLRDGKAHYVDLLPRVWEHLIRDLSHPSLSALADITLAHLPAPDQPILHKVKEQCATVPAR